MRRIGIMVRDECTGKICKALGRPPKMELMEQTLGVVFEDDYRDLYIENNWSNKKFAARWKVARGLIFPTRNTENRGRRVWLTWDDNFKQLPRRNEIKTATGTQPEKQSLCPLCKTCIDEFNTPDKAHWHSLHKGGKLTIKTCTNCNRRMVNKDPKTISQYLLFLLNSERHWDVDNMTDLVNGILEFQDELT